MVATKNENAKRRNGNKSGNLRKVKGRGNRNNRMNRRLIDDAMFVDQFENPGYLDFNCPIITKPIAKNSLKNNYKNRSNRRQQQQQSQGWAPPLPLLPNGMMHPMHPPPLPLMPPMNGRMHHRGPPMMPPPPLPLMPPMNSRMHHRGGGPPMMPMMPNGGGRFGPPPMMMMPPRPPNLRSNNNSGGGGAGGGGSMRRNKNNRRNKRKNLYSNNKKRSKINNKSNNLNQYSLDKPWVNDEIKDEYKKKEELELKLKGNKNDELFAEFKLQRDKFVNLYEIARLEHVEKTEIIEKEKEIQDEIIKEEKLDDQIKDVIMPTESDIPETINTEIETS